MKRKTLIQSISVVIIISIVIIVLKACQSTKGEIKIETTRVSRGSITNTVTATGTIQAIKTVAVGTQVSGVINKIYVDFNSIVKKGQILAQIDQTPLIANLNQSKASVESAIADQDYKKTTYDRFKALYEKKLIAKSDYDQAVLNWEQSKANLANAKSSYDKNKINLEYATIYSPINGVVLNRAVDEGQTVAASFNTPTLFSIANDLTQMRVEANVDEADIGQVKLGQRVEFNVDAYPEDKFTGTVTQIRLQPVITSNVVTYTVIIEAPNPEKKLMPGMTANANIFVTEANDLLIVDSKALRFTPDSTILNEYLKKYPQTLQPEKKPKYAKNKGKGMEGERVRPTMVWVKKGNEIKRIKVETGLSDGANIEIKSGLSEGEEVIYAMESATATEPTSREAVKSPFMPSRPSRNAPKK